MISMVTFRIWKISSIDPAAMDLNGTFTVYGASFALSRLEVSKLLLWATPQGPQASSWCAEGAWRVSIFLKSTKMSVFALRKGQWSVAFASCSRWRIWRKEDFLRLNGKFSQNVWYLVVIALQFSLRHGQWFPVTFAFFLTCFLSLRVVFLEACHGLPAGYYA